MITFVRTATIAPGKVGEALAFAHQIAKLVDKITGLKVGVSMPVSGNPFRIAWVAAEPDLASLEANTNKLLSNPEYMKMSEGRRFAFPARFGARRNVAQRLTRAAATGGSTTHVLRSYSTKAKSASSRGPRSPFSRLTSRHWPGSIGGKRVSPLASSATSVMRSRPARAIVWA